MRDDFDDDLDDTVVRARRPAGPTEGDDHDDPLGDTVIRPRRSVADGDPADDTVIRPRPSASDGDPADDTVLRPRLRPLQGAPATTWRSPTAPPTDGHRPTGPAPRLPVDDVPVRRVPSVRIGDRVVRLDRPVVVGRRPAAPRVVRGPQPELVAVPSASGQVSSSHVLVHASGEAAVVEDLRSTNGTVVRPVAGRPFRLASGASVVVLTGTVVEIGDGNVLEILSPHLRVSVPDPDPAPPWP